MSDSADILIIGPGRLGRCMTRWLRMSGRSVELIGRGQAIPRASVTWLTVPDRAIAEVAAQVPMGTILLHASGTMELDPLEPHERIGSLHPLMTFTGAESRSDMPDMIPAAVCGHPDARAAAETLALELGMTPFDYSGDRRIYHAAAVLSGNFATVLLARAAQLLSSQGVDEAVARAMLAPLAAQSIRNAAAGAARDVLTGPVARGDHEVIRNHMDALQEWAPEQCELYKVLLGEANKLLS
jgi:predicted short-subunit dehydrogenase-like oxidoreductase (DUF2520 family)